MLDSLTPGRPDRTQDVNDWTQTMLVLYSMTSSTDLTIPVANRPNMRPWVSQCNPSLKIRVEVPGGYSSGAHQTSHMRTAQQVVANSSQLCLRLAHSGKMKSSPPRWTYEMRKPGILQTRLEERTKAFRCTVLSCDRLLPVSARWLPLENWKHPRQVGHQGLEMFKVTDMPSRGKGIYRRRRAAIKVVWHSSEFGSHSSSFGVISHSVHSLQIVAACDCSTWQTPISR